MPINPEASSTSELVFHLICALGDFRLIDKEMAQCIYTGIMTDTGALSYNSNNSNLFQVVAHLLDKGVDKDEIYRLVYNNYSESRLRLQGFVLNNKMQVFPEKSTSLITLTDKELKKFKFKKGDTEGFVNMPLQINGVLMSAFFREDKEAGVIKLSFRSVAAVISSMEAVIRMQPEESTAAHSRRQLKYSRRDLTSGPVLRRIV